MHATKTKKLNNLIITLILDWSKPSKNIDWTDHTTPTRRTKYDVNPKIVIKISEIKAPNGPPRFSTTPSEFLLKKPESASVYETKLIKTYRENAIRKKLRKLTKVFCKYGFDMRFINYCKLKPLLNHNFFNIEL